MEEISYVALAVENDLLLKYFYREGSLYFHSNGNSGKGVLIEETLEDELSKMRIWCDDIVEGAENVRKYLMVRELLK